MSPARCWPGGGCRRGSLGLVSCMSRSAGSCLWLLAILLLRRWVGIETDHGPWVTALIAAGYVVFAVNPLQAPRFRGRHGVSGAKSDGGDAHMLADVVRTDAHQLRPAAADSPAVQAVKVLTRTHKTLIWERAAVVLRLRAQLLEYFPARRACQMVCVREVPESLK